MSVFHGSMEKGKLAAVLLLTSPGTPYIYYGEEIGMQGEKPDEDIRLPMQWSADANAGFTTGTPWLAPFRANGKALHIHGFRAAFTRAARRSAALLRELGATGVPLVGVDPAMTLCYRGEYAHALGQGEAPRVLLLQNVEPALESGPPAFPLRLASWVGSLLGAVLDSLDVAIGAVPLRSLPHVSSSSFERRPSTLHATSSWPHREDA